MPATARVQSFPVATDPADHAIREFSQGVQLMAESHGTDEDERQVGDLVAALTRELQKQVRTKPHPFLYVILVSNFAFFLTVVFAAGTLYQRVQNLEDRVHAMANTDAITSKLTDMTDQQNQMRREIENMRDRLDRALDKR